MPSGRPKGSVCLLHPDPSAHLPPPELLTAPATDRIAVRELVGKKVRGEPPCGLTCMPSGVYVAGSRPRLGRQPGVETPCRGAAMAMAAAWMHGNTGPRARRP